MIHTRRGVGRSLGNGESVATFATVSVFVARSTVARAGMEVAKVLLVVVATAAGSVVASRRGRTTGLVSGPPTSGCPPSAASKIISEAKDLAISLSPSITADPIAHGFGENISIKPTTLP